MATLKQIRRRIRTVRSTRHITKAMEMVAAAKLRRAQAAAAGARPYADAMQGVLQRLAGASRTLSHPLFELRAVRRLAVVAVAADKGLCGGFNTSVLRRAQACIGEAPDGAAEIVPVGRRMWRAFRAGEREGALGLELLGDLADWDAARDLAQRLTERFLEGRVDRVDVVYTHFETVARREVVKEALIPVEPRRGEGVPGDYIFEPDAAQVLAQLLPRYIATRLFAIFAESVASEHAARMQAMGNATRNADEMIESLTLTGNKLRQAAITRELTELVGGAEALI
ncbi:MAG: ATP synthase F1 subunit gamma [Candidatus Eisenbacteria bacterium]|nr:ATP synthase F1 subunit gamma [Candidatus Eisenbacteria bacterium]